MKVQITDLNKFKSLYWLYYDRSLLKASSRLNLTPSGIRQSIKSLEKQLGIQLFIVSGKSYVPTKEAGEFVGLISPFFDSLEEKIEKFGKEKKELVGDLVIGVPFVYSYELFTKLSYEFVQKHSEAKIQVVSSGTAALVEKLIQNELDFAICYDGPEVISNQKIIHNQISEDFLVLCYNPTKIILKVEKPSLSLLKTLKHVSYTPNSLLLRRWYEYHFSKFPSLNVPLMANNVPAIRELILAGAGLGILPYSYIKKDLRKGNLQIIGTKKKKLKNNRVLIQNADKVPSLLEKAFIKFLFERTNKNLGRET